MSGKGCNECGWSSDDVNRLTARIVELEVWTKELQQVLRRAHAKYIDYWGHDENGDARHSCICIYCTEDKVATGK